ncbi:hypothetical protein GN956_G24926 [Arapaima gigas]
MASVYALTGKEALSGWNSPLNKKADITTLEASPVTSPGSSSPRGHIQHRGWLSGQPASMFHPHCFSSRS